MSSPPPSLADDIVHAPEAPAAPPTLMQIKQQVDAVLASMDEALGDEIDPELEETPAAGPAELSLAAPAPLTAASPFALGARAPGSSPFSLGSGSIFGRPPAAAAAEAALETPGSFEARLEEYEKALVPPAAEPPPPCRPDDYGDYLKRVATYSAGPGWWFAKPDALVPPRCARLGWTLVAQDTLACAACNARYTPAELPLPEVPELPPFDPDRIPPEKPDPDIPNGIMPDDIPMSKEAVAAEWRALGLEPPDETQEVEEPPDPRAAELNDAHAALCPWRGHGSPEAFLSLLLPGRHRVLPPSLPKGAAVARESLRNRYAALLRLPSLPRLEPSLSAEWEECAEACGYAPTDEGMRAWRAALVCFLSSSAAAPELVDHDDHQSDRRWVGAALAILGWEVGDGEGTKGAKGISYLYCPEDGRSVGLWRFEAVGSGGQAVPARPAGAAGAPVFGAAFGAAPGSPGFLRAASGAPAPEAHDPMDCGDAFDGCEAIVASIAAVAADAATVSEAHAAATNGTERLDPFMEHKMWSPWLAPTAGDTMPAWVRQLQLALPPAARGPLHALPAQLTARDAADAMAAVLQSF